MGMGGGGFKKNFDLESFVSKLKIKFRNVVNMYSEFFFFYLKYVRIVFFC